MRLEGKVAVVTGASRGLGEYVAEAYAREGATVVVAARTETAADPRLPGTIHDTVERITLAGGKALAVRCNVADVADCRALIEQTIAAFGRIDILVNNAAVQPPGSLTTMQPKHWDLEFRINLNGPFYLSQAAFGPMREQGSGVMINVSSGGADQARAGAVGVYGISKVALETMTVGFAREGKPFGIAVNALKPKGAVDTPGIRFAHAARGQEAPPDLPGPETYVEAAIILATATPDTFTGQAINDVDTIARFGRGSVIAPR